MGEKLQNINRGYSESMGDVFIFLKYLDVKKKKKRFGLVILGEAP